MAIKSDSLDTQDKIDAIRTLVTIDHIQGRVWCTEAYKRRKRGEELAPLPGPAGYRRFKLGPIFYAMHRVIWAHVNGPIPDGMQIDHINGVRSDNRVSNLRMVTSRINSQNQRRPRGVTSTGILGVSWNKAKRKYTAKIASRGTAYHLGSFADPMEAHQAYLEAKRRLHPGCTI